MLTIKLLLADMQLQYGIDESYKLSIPATGNPIYAHLEVCKAVLAFFCFTNLYTRKHVLLFHQANAFMVTCSKVPRTVARLKISK